MLRFRRTSVDISVVKERASRLGSKSILGSEKGWRVEGWPGNHIHGKRNAHLSRHDGQCNASDYERQSNVAMWQPGDPLT